MGGARPEGLRGRAVRRGARPVPAVALALGLSAACGAAAPPPAPLPSGDYTPRHVPSRLAIPPARAAALRDDALARARVWSRPAEPVEQADLLHNPPGGYREADEITCRFLPRPSQGRTPKFQCVRAGGEVIKVKYGRENNERLAEVAGSRLGLALGFGADHMSVVRRVTCWGCPRYPYPRFAWLDSLLADFSRASEFEYPVLERPFPGLEIETPVVEGWAWNEIERVDAARGGSSRAEVDALRLFAVFLNHWDNKAPNQRLTCRSGGGGTDGACAEPFALIHDYGATFGPRRAALEAWQGRPVWLDAASCTVSMRGLPYDGGTFPDHRISEEGRAFLAERLGGVRTEQVRDLFVGARFGERGSATVEAWVRAFEDRVRQIVEREPCHDS